MTWLYSILIAIGGCACLALVWAGIIWLMLSVSREVAGVAFAVILFGAVFSLIVLTVHCFIYEGS